MRKLLFAPFALLFVAGCGGESNPLRDAARSIATARAYDRAVAAEKRDDAKTSEAALRELETLQLPPVVRASLAEGFVRQAVEIDTFNNTSRDDSPVARDARTRSAAFYRRALKIAGGASAFNPEDAQLSNALGYFLADHGTTAQDFRDAETLTRASLKRFDAQIAQASPGASVDALKLQRAVTSHDSLAWALYKQRRYDEAFAEQTKVLRDIELAETALKTQLGDAQTDLFYHMGAIRAAQGEVEDARRFFARALKLQPKHAATLRALKALPSANARA